MKSPLALCCVLLSVAIATSCTEVKRIIPNSTWHEKCGWKAEDYFKDPQVIALCKAIEADDVPEIDRLVAAGVDVNAQGKGKMTPLLWAYPDNKLWRFKRLLKHGANPNVIIESDFNTRGGMSVGDSVTHMACKTSFPGYFEAVFENGGDVNLRKKTLINLDETPLFCVIKGAPDKRAKIRFLIRNGADLNLKTATGMTPTMTAVGWGGQYDIALQLLEAGADPAIYQDNEAQKLTHVVVRQESTHLRFATPQQRADYDKLVKWLESHGESVKEAKEDLQRWSLWGYDAKVFRRNLDAEIAARKRKEARENAAAGDSAKAGNK